MDPSQNALVNGETPDSLSLIENLVPLCKEDLMCAKTRAWKGKKHLSLTERICSMCIVKKIDQTLCDIFLFSHLTVGGACRDM